MEAKKQLLKDLALVVVTWVIVDIVLIPMIGEGAGLSVIFAGLPFVGIPFGWRWSSKVITAVSLVGILIKFVIAVALGLIALPLILVKDIISCVMENKTEGFIE